MNHAKEKISDKFSQLGLIDKNDVALILAAKMNKKTYKNSIFVIGDEDITQLIEQITNLIEKDTSTNIIKFQIIHFPQSHAIFGEFEIDKTTNPPTVRYLHCDPAPHVTGHSAIVTSDFISKISQLANIEIYDSNVTIQRGVGCSYFSIDGAMMLSTPNYAVDVIDYMKKHGEEKEKNPENNKIKYIQSPSLPTRFIRGLQYIDGKEGRNRDNPNLYREPNIFASVFNNTTEKTTIVNKVGETAEIAIRKDLAERPYRSNPQDMRTFNIRAERKMKNYGKAVHDFVKNIDILDPDFSKQLDRYKIKGLTQFCEEKIEQKKEKKNKM